MRLDVMLWSSTGYIRTDVHNLNGEPHLVAKFRSFAAMNLAILEFNDRYNLKMKTRKYYMLNNTPISSADFKLINVPDVKQRSIIKAINMLVTKGSVDIKRKDSDNNIIFTPMV